MDDTSQPSAAHRVFSIPELLSIILQFAEPASHKVFALPPLLNRILSFLPPHEVLLSCTLVNKQWHTTLSSSPVLFLTPAAYPHDPPKQPWDPEFDYNPNEPSNEAYIINPFLKHALPNFLYGPKDSAHLAPPCVTATNFRSLPWLKNPAAWKRKDASWRKMQISQPPVVWFLFHARHPEYRIFDGLETLPCAFNTDGVVPYTVGYTMGQLYDYLWQTSLFGDENIIRDVLPEITLWIHRQGWEDGECEISVDIDYFSTEHDEFENEGVGEEMKDVLRSEGYEEWCVDMTEEYLPPVG